MTAGRARSPAAKAGSTCAIGDLLRGGARRSRLLERDLTHLGDADHAVQEYERGSIIVTSNRGFEAWGEIPGDAMVAAALIDRLVHHAHIVTLKGKSYRLRERGTASAPAAEIQPAGLRPTT